MVSETPIITDITQLRQYVYENLCHQNDFEPGAFQITERVLLRSGAPCGILFCLHGPRNVKLNAIWEAEQNHVFFYGSTGRRTHQTRLSAGPSLTVNL